MYACTLVENESATMVTSKSPARPTSVVFLQLSFAHRHNCKIVETNLSKYTTNIRILQIHATSIANPCLAQFVHVHKIYHNSLATRVLKALLDTLDNLQNDHVKPQN